MKIVFEEYAKIRDLDVKTLKFFFDGEIIKASKTAEQCELEDGFCIDVIS